VVGDYDVFSVSTDLWEYNPTLNQWGARKKIPGIVDRFMYSNNGLGHVYSNVNFNYKHYAYNRLTDDWQIIDDNIPMFVGNLNTYIISDDSIYVLLYNSGNPELFVYYIYSNTWSRLPYRGGIRLYPLFFNIGYIIYLGSGRFSNFNSNDYLDDFWNVDLTKNNP
jgi:hypothetical protein